MFKTAGEIVSSFSLHTCTQCGTCDNVCPSGRNGGIHPDAFVNSMTEASPSEKISNINQDVWKCLMCHRCSSSCPTGIDVAGAIRSLRYDSAISGSAPKRFTKTGGTLAETGRAFPVNELVNRKREQLGLDPIGTDQNTMRELKTIMKRTRFCDE